MKFFLLSILHFLAFRTIHGVEQKSDHIGNVRSRQLKKSKKGKKTLVAAVGKAPTYDGNLNPLGTVTMHFNPYKSFLVVMDMNELDANCVSGEINCALRVVEESCEGSPYTSEMDFNNITAFYNAQSGGISRSSFVFNNGADYNMNKGKYVVMEDADENLIACGMLIPDIKKKTLKVSFGKYPGSSALVNPKGKAVVKFEEDNSFILSYSISGMEENCLDCGLHIHEGTSCASPELVLGHGWNTAQTQDLWFAKFGAVYNSDDRGRAKGSFRSYNGYGYLNNLNHAVVLHGVGGKRVGCGVLEEV